MTQVMSYEIAIREAIKPGLAELVFDIGGFKSIQFGSDGFLLIGNDGAAYSVKVERHEPGGAE